MKRAGSRASPRFVPLAVLILLVGGVTTAENIDPDRDGSRFAWSENLGWLNAQPSGPGGPGLQVSDSNLTGYMWSENAGWISLSCTNTTCATVSYGVINDGCGALSGYAWSENAGWINFAPTTCGADPMCGVKISPTTGIFSGRAWSENAGWITFLATSPTPYRVATAWHRAVPAGQATLTVGKSVVSSAVLTWTALSDATGYDAVYGDLNVLRSSGGNFQPATLGQLACGSPLLSFDQIGNPTPGNGFWFLERGRNCGGTGSYGGALREAEIAASGHDCP